MPQEPPRGAPTLAPVKTPLLRHIIAAAVPALILVGCSASPDVDPTASTAASATPTPVETPSATASPDTSVDEGSDIDEQDGVRTNSFNALPDEFGGMPLQGSQSDPSVHMAQRDYKAADDQTRLLIMAYIPQAQEEGYVPVSSNSDAGFRSAVDSAHLHLEDQGLEVIERSAAAGAYEWECFEALQTQATSVDHSFCMTTGYGRVIELQRLAVHDPDAQARNSSMDALLEEISAALADIKP